MLNTVRLDAGSLTMKKADPVSNLLGLFQQRQRCQTAVQQCNLWEDAWFSGLA